MYLPVGPGQDKGARVELMYLPVGPGQDKGARVEMMYLPVGPGQDEGARVELMYLPVGPGQDEGARADVHHGDELGRAVPVVAADLLQQGHDVVTAPHELAELHPELHDKPCSRGETANVHQ